ncbi:hypothetical protein Hypma_011764 [Hypsizygus marmoreus]|uniref:BTB domain-containing protein n=1 Tax=Hypsizygus marmoreus TaxID=39966 RepID=A0A369JPC6_HYPMA|nr:hypothetical protein Hypma_011764 [Hypsizygus marmoreus]
MSANNSPGAAIDVKREEMDSPHPYCCCGSGEPMPHTFPSAPAQACKPTVPLLQPHHISPVLAGVPLEYIIDQLRNLASHYWNKPETTDCTIIVPIPHGGTKRIHPSLSSYLPPLSRSSVSSMHDPSGLGRRATEPSLNVVPRIALKLHMDYLSAHSSYIRALLSGASPLDLIHTTATAFNGPSSNTRFKIPANRLPRLMPGSHKHPTLYLPVPDPPSFPLLVHWMYFGDTDPIDDCLHKGLVHWEGIARNVEYLGLSTEIKIFLGQWYGRWLHPERVKADGGYDDDSDTAYSDSDDDDSDSSTASVMDDSDVESNDEKEVWRGRTRTMRPLSYQEPGTRFYGQ